MTNRSKVLIYLAFLFFLEDAFILLSNDARGKKQSQINQKFGTSHTEVCHTFSRVRANFRSHFILTRIGGKP